MERWADDGDVQVARDFDEGFLAKDWDRVRARTADDDHVEELLRLDAVSLPGGVALDWDFRARVEGHAPTFHVGQRAVVTVRDGRVARFDMLCSGFRPVPSEEGAA